jgi:hypothetical protein
VWVGKAAFAGTSGGCAAEAIEGHHDDAAANCYYGNDEDCRVHQSIAVHRRMPFLKREHHTLFRKSVRK